MLRWVETRPQGQQSIEAVLIDDTHHSLSPRVLDVMLYNKMVKKFKRATGWVTVGIHPTRSNHGLKMDFNCQRERRIAERGF